MQTNLRTPRNLFHQPVRYEIPAFQRRYVWKQDEQWEPLWDDVENLAQSLLEHDHAEPHFMGAIVLQQKLVAAATIERRIVVDGQQRLTTLQLLIDAIQEVLEDRGHSNPAKRLADLVDNDKEYRSGEPDHAFKVWPTVMDQVSFRHAMSNELSAQDHAASRIVQAHEYFKGQAARWLDEFRDEPEVRDRAANALDKAVSTKLEIVVIDLGTSDDPHIIFETLNARGTPLLQSDMVKNKVLHDAKSGLRDDDDEASTTENKIWPFGQDDWWAHEVGRGLQRRPRVDVFLNHWLTLRNRRVMKPYDEFRAFETYAQEREHADDTIHDIARDLGKIGSIYREVEEVQRGEIKQFLERRNVMNVGVVTPLLLWLLSAGLTAARLANCLKALESFLVRRVVCGYSARSYGDVFVELLARLAGGDSGDSADKADRILVSYLSEQTSQAALWPGDDELRERFMTAPLYPYLTRGRLRMVLAGIEEELRTNKAESGDVPGDLHIEHIMPQAWQENYPLPDHRRSDEYAADDRDRTVHTIGNLTLVNCRLNSSLSNAGWNNKRATLAEHSVLYLNKALVNEGPDVWDETEIERRAEWLHERAVNIWPHATNIKVEL